MNLNSGDFVLDNTYGIKYVVKEVSDKLVTASVVINVITMEVSPTTEILRIDNLALLRRSAGFMPRELVTIATKVSREWVEDAPYWLQSMDDYLGLNGRIFGYDYYTGIP